MALKALIFDFDGTLVDTTALHARAWQQAFQEAGYAVGPDRIEQEIGKGGTLLVPDLVGERAENEHGDRLRRRHGEIYQAAAADASLQAFDGVIDLLDAVRDRGLKIAIATAASRVNLERSVERTLPGLLDHVDAVVTDSDVTASKPHPDAVLPAVEKLGLHPAQCAMVGDTVYDVVACTWAGLVCLGVTTGPHTAAQLHHAGARAVYDDLADLHANLDDALALASPGERVVTAALLERLMDAALEEARRGMEADQVPIGSVLARSDGTILGRGHNQSRQLGTRVAHAEMQALYDAAAPSVRDARDLILATTLEPCTMCLGAAMVAHVDTIVYALPAPSNGGIARVTPHDTPGSYLPRCIGGVGRAKSRSLLEAWLAQKPHHTFVRDLLEQVGA
jgi:HAD superfamily hydrolase (TIGR01509 family)